MSITTGIVVFEDAEELDYVGPWEVFGMAANLGPHQPPMVMNLEDPDDFFGPQETDPANSNSQVPQQARQPAQDPFRQ